MAIRPILLFIFVLALSAAANAHAETSGSSIPEVRDGKGRQAEYERMTEELKQLQDGLPAKKTELAQLRRKWVVVKGRMPTQEELEEFEEQRAEGEVSVADNPYVNKNPLSSPGRYRGAYYKKLDEVRGDEARIARLRDEIKALNP